MKLYREILICLILIIILIGIALEIDREKEQKIIRFGIESEMEELS